MPVRHGPGLVSVAAAAVVAVVACPAGAGAQSPVPVIGTVQAVDVPSGLAYALAAEHSPGVTVGVSIACEPGELSVVADFGPFPADARPVQFSLRSRGGAVTRFSDVVRGDLAARSHSPRLLELDAALAFLELALEPGALVLNGHRSFRLALGADRARALLAEVRTCAARLPRPGRASQAEADRRLLDAGDTPR